MRSVSFPRPTRQRARTVCCAGQYHWADNLTPESYARIHGKPDVRARHADGGALGAVHHEQPRRAR